MVQIPGVLIERLRARQAVLVAGLGPSVLAGAPSWAELLAVLADRMGGTATADREKLERLLASGRYADALTFLRRRVGEDDVAFVVERGFGAVSNVPEPIRRVAALPWRAILTTSFDTAWQRALGDHYGPEAVRTLIGVQGPTPMGGGRSVLIQVCGAAGAPETLCLGHTDVRTRLIPSGAWQQLSTLARRRSLVLVGFRASDPELAWLELLLGPASAAALAPPDEGDDEAGARPPHFLLLDHPSEVDTLLMEERFGLQVLPCAEGTGEALAALADAASGLALPARPAAGDLRGWIEAARREPDNPEAHAALQSVAASLAAAEDWLGLAELDVTLGDLAEEPSEKVSLYRRAAGIYRERLDARDRALTVTASALREAPDSREILDELLSDAAVTGGWAEFARACAAAARRAASGGGDQRRRVVAARLLREAARATAGELADVQGAVAAYEEALAVLAPPPAGKLPSGDSGSAEVDRSGPVASDVHEQQAIRDELADLFRAHGRWGELAALLGETADRTRDPVRRAELLIESAAILEERLGNVSGAADVLGRVLELDPESEAALAALERIFRQQERWVDLAKIHQLRAKRLAPRAAVVELQKAAEVLERQAGDAAGAARALEDALAIDPTNRGVLRALERLYEPSGTGQAVGQPQGDEDKYLAVLERLVEVAADDEERSQVLRRIAAEWEAWPDGLDRAADALEQVLCIHPGDREALRALARLYRAAHRPLALADVIAKQIDGAQVDEERRELTISLAKVYELELGDTSRAAEAYAAAEALGDTRDTTFESLAGCYERQERWPACVATLERWAAASRDTFTQADALFRAGDLLWRRLDDSASAEVRFNRALETDPHHVGALSALAELCRARGDRARAAGLFAEAGERSDNHADKLRYLYDAATLQLETFGESDRAIDLLTRVLALDPEHVEAAERLLGIHERRQQWAAMEPLIEVLARKIDRAHPARAASILVRAGLVASRLGDTERALERLEAARALQPEARVVLEGLAAVRMRRQEWGEARGLLQAVLRLYRNTLAPADVAAIYEQLAQCDVEDGEVAGAVGWLEKALAMDPRRRPALEALTALHTNRGDWAAVVVAKRSLLETEDAAGRGRVLEEIGDIYRDRMRNLAQAATAYQAAFEADPTRRTTLRRLLDIYSEAKRWPSVADVLVAMADLEEDATVRARYFHTAALVRRDQIGDVAGSVPLLEQALDLAPTMFQAWDDLEAVLKARQDWHELAAALRRMLSRLDEDPDADPDLRLRLWSELGNVAIEQLADAPLAIEAFEEVLQLSPDELTAREHLANLYTEGGPDHLDKAIAMHQGLLADNPDRLSSYRALSRLYALAGAPDERFCVASTLTFLRKADAEIEAFWARHQPRHMPRAQSQFDDEMWQRIAHPDEDPLVGALLGVIGPVIAAARAQNHAAVGLRRKDRADLGANGKPALRTVAYVSETLDMSPPDVFVRDSDGAESTGATVLTIQERGVLRPTVVLATTLAGQRSESHPDLLFELAMTLTLLRPERLSRQVLGSPVAVAHAVGAALLLGGSDTLPVKDAAEVERMVAAVRRHASRVQLAEIVAVAERVRAERGDVIDARRWVAGVDLTAARVALLLSGDLRAAARVLSADRLWSSPLTAKQRLKDLLAFSVSDEYFYCRKRLGFAVG